MGSSHGHANKTRLPRPLPEQEEEVADQREQIEAACKDHHCGKYVKIYENCVERLAAVPEDERKAKALNCQGQMFDLKHCIDHCAAKKIFAQGK